MGSPLLSVIGVVVAAVATLFTYIGLTSTGWTAGGTGLFKTCYATICVDRPAAYVADYLHATRAMVILGFVLGVACVVVLVVYIIKNDMKIMQLVGMLLAFVAALFLLVGTIIYSAANSNAGLGYSFALTVLGAFLFMITGTIHRRKSHVGPV